MSFTNYNEHLRIVADANRKMARNAGVTPYPSNTTIMHSTPTISERNAARYKDRDDLRYLELLMLRVKEYNEASEAYLRNKTIDTNRRRVFAAKDKLNKALHFLRKRGYEYYIEDKPVKQRLFND